MIGRVISGLFSAAGVGGALWPLLAGGLGIFAAGAASGGYLAYQYVSGQLAKSENKILVEAALQQQRAAQEIMELSEAFENARNQRRIVYRDITREVDKIVERPVYRADCLDADGLRLVNRALAGQAAAARQPDQPVPAVGSAGRGWWFGRDP
ncbi:MAG: hypothetical protein HQL44_17135 [Alphaproteobacteria bacterium]|nr:hypothetical protein [Alphaproteobacteria bacterium]